MPEISPILNIPQSRFINLPHKFRAFVAGFGSGKTWVGGAATCKHFWEFPKINSGYFAPSYPQIRDIFYPTIEEVAFSWGLTTDVKESNKEVHFYSGSKYRGTTICRSMDDPGSIVGFKIGHALVDEYDLLQMDKALLAHKKIIARMRYNVDGLRNGVDFTTTPEGFKATYKLFVDDVTKDPKKANNYGLIHASTYDNAKNLPADYIPSLLEAYPDQLISAYLNGQFVNLTSGTVYNAFDRKLNHSDEVEKDGEALHVGMDFNVQNMAAIVHIERNGLPIAVNELTGVYDTPAMIRLIKDRFPRHKIIVYPDASGQNRKTVDASTNDLALLRQAGFQVVVDSANPGVKDRIVAMNAAFLNATGERRYKVNTKRCPEYTRCLEQQAYDKHGQPDKTSGVDHANDAGGYYICKRLPVNRPAASVPFRGR
jgi:hypothetical protein